MAGRLLASAYSTPGRHAYGCNNTLIPTSRSARLAAFPPYPASVDPASLAHVLHLRPVLAALPGHRWPRGRHADAFSPGELRPSIAMYPHIPCAKEVSGLIGVARNLAHRLATGRRQFHDRPGMSQIDFKIGSGRRIFGAPVHQAHHAAFSSEVRRTSALSSASLAILPPLIGSSRR